MKVGDVVKIKESEMVGRLHKGQKFIVDSDVRPLCGSDVVRLNNLDGTRFSVAYDVDMLETIPE